VLWDCWRGGAWGRGGPPCLYWVHQLVWDLLMNKWWQRASRKSRRHWPWGGRSQVCLQEASLCYHATSTAAGGTRLLRYLSCDLLQLQRRYIYSGFSALFPGLIQTYRHPLSKISTD
jgi:hypothetical protein